MTWNPLELRLGPTTPFADLLPGSALRPHCVGCPLAKPGNFARTDGKGYTGILALAEGLGETEAEWHLPLVGATGEYFDKLVGKIKWDTPLDRDAFLLGNVINCRPPDNKLTNTKYEMEATFRCRPYLDEVLEKFKPKGILAMGNHAMRAVTGNWGLDRWRGYRQVGVNGIPVVATYHPAFILRGKLGYSYLWLKDAQKLLNIVAGRWKVAPVEYIQDPSEEEALIWAMEYLQYHPEEPLAWDLETDYSGTLDEDDDEYFERVLEDDPSYNINRISFSYRERTAISFPWKGRYIEVAKLLLESKGPKLIFNYVYDYPRVAAQGIHVGGDTYDVMLIWRAWQPQLRYSLAQAAATLTDMDPWKHLSGSNPAFYSCADSDAPVRIYNILRPIMEKSGQWAMYERHMMVLMKHLMRLQERGVPTNRELRRETRDRLIEQRAAIVQELNQLVPREIRTVHPKEGYKKTKEQLLRMKKSPWVEGSMVEIEVEVPDEEVKNGKLETAGLGTDQGQPEGKAGEAAKGPRKARARKRKAAAPGNVGGDPGPGERHPGGRDALLGNPDGPSSPEERSHQDASRDNSDGHREQDSGRHPSDVARRETTRGDSPGDQGDGGKGGVGAPPDPREHIAIVGSRSFPDLERVRKYVLRLDPSKVVVHSGESPGGGVDIAVREACKEGGIPFVPHPPANRSALALKARNTEVVQATVKVVAFWTGSSPGTQDTIWKARAARKPVEVILP